MINELARRLDRMGEWLERIPPFMFGAAMLFLLVMRNGLHHFDTDWPGLYATVQALPEAMNYNSWSWGNLVLARLLGISSWEQWLALHTVLTCAAVIAPLFVLARRHRSDFHLLSVFWVLIPAVGSLLLWVGMYDVLTYLGAVLILLARSWWVAAIGALVMSSGNPEQAVVAAFILLAASGLHLLRNYRRTALVSLAVTLLGLIATRILIQGPTGIDRTEVLLSPLEGVRKLVFEWPASIWGLNGVLWVVVIAGFILSSARGKIALSIAFGVIPLAAILVTGDWYRVYWFVTLAALMALGLTLITSNNSDRARRILLVIGLASLILVPSQTGSFFFLYDALGSLVQLAR